MYEIKKQIYLDFTKNQKASLLNYLRAYVKKCINLEVSEIFNRFLDDEKYYQELNCSKFEFLKDVIYEKQKREFLKKVKMSKESPTKKQLYYYDRLCKKYELEKKELTSKLEAMEEIDKIIKEHDISVNREL